MQFCLNKIYNLQNGISKSIMRFIHRKKNSSDWLIRLFNFDFMHSYPLSSGSLQTCRSINNFSTEELNQLIVYVSGILNQNKIKINRDVRETLDQLTEFCLKQFSLDDNLLSIQKLLESPMLTHMRKEYFYRLIKIGYHTKNASIRMHIIKKVLSTKNFLKLT